jgi:hypothetical protein
MTSPPAVSRTSQKARRSTQPQVPSSHA